MMTPESAVTSAVGEGVGNPVREDVLGAVVSTRDLRLDEASGSAKIG